MTKANLRRMYEKNCWSTLRIARELSCNDESVRKAMIRYEIPIRSKSHAGKIKKISSKERERLKSHFANLNLNKMGDKHPSWKGGRYKDSYGYITRRIDGKVIKEHRHVMQEHLGRKLMPWEEVNHINLIKDDNRIENLEVIYSEHKHKDWIARHKKKTTNKVFTLNPEQVKAYEKMSGFETTGHVTMSLSSDEVWDLFDKLLSPQNGKTKS